MVEVVFGENATGSLKLAQAYGKGCLLYTSRNTGPPKASTVRRCQTTIANCGHKGGEPRVSLRASEGPKG